MVNDTYFDIRLNPAFRLATYPLGTIKKIIERHNYRNSEYPELVREFKNVHKDERCFIIGNGPSLRTKDLELIKNEVTFGSNRIFALFDKTIWRPTYYFATDFAIIQNNYNDICNIECEKKFIDSWAMNKVRKIDNCIYICSNPFYIINPCNYKKSYVEVDISRYIRCGFTVSYTMIVAAIYMGFKEIYLLGMDFSMPYYRDKWGFSHSSGEKEAHFKGGDTMKRVYLLKESNMYAFCNARTFCENNGISIYNATRGGKLDIFDRIDLEKVING